LFTDGLIAFIVSFVPVKQSLREGSLVERVSLVDFACSVRERADEDFSATGGKGANQAVSAAKVNHFSFREVFVLNADEQYLLYS
jgi:hypothetical protein